tara:strand:- start:3291 stop:3719 length:429 start_codon:yes stop_codon:yes gene_type:complete
MTEKKFQVLFGNYLKKNPPNKSEVYELKVTKQPSVRFDALAPHQVHNLTDALNYGVYHKISDAPIHRGMRTRFTYKKPFDCLYIKAQHAYVVVLFYKPRAEKFAVMIPIYNWLEEQSTSSRKSLTEERAHELADWVVSLKGY